LPLKTSAFFRKTLFIISLTVTGKPGSNHKLAGSAPVPGLSGFYSIALIAGRLFEPEIQASPTIRGKTLVSSGTEFFSSNALEIC
jgi:hypothetical protein